MPNSYDTWLIMSNFNQSIATIFGVFGNVLLLYMIKFVSLRETKCLIPLLKVHCIIGFVQIPMNVLICARIFIIKGYFFIVLSNPSVVKNLWKPIFITSIVWLALFELFLLIINSLYRYLVIAK
jgi:hypothetical protein